MNTSEFAGAKLDLEADCENLDVLSCESAIDAISKIVLGC